MTNTLPPRPLRVWVGLLLGGLLGTSAMAQDGADTPEPYHSAAEVSARLYQGYLPRQAERFEQTSKALVQAVQRYCDGTVPAASARNAWREALAAWDGLSTVPSAPLIQRRSQRRVDFTPTRPALIERAVARSPANLADMALVGTPAKGLPGLEWLLWKHAPIAGTPACRYAEMVAADIADEAHAIATELEAWKTKDWEENPEDAATALAEWLNQWLGGLERLRWQHMEKPLRSTPKGQTPEWTRAASGSDADSWRTQWAVLRGQALRAGTGKRDAPVSIEGLLMGQGHMDVARRWANAVSSADAAIQKLPAHAPGSEKAAASLLTATARLKALTAMFQAEVAPALNVMLGFSDADGD
jgi:hypothetical protein